MSRRAGALDAGAALFVLLLGWIAWRYRSVEDPHALARLAALGGWLGIFTLATIGVGAPLWRRACERPLAGLEAWLVALASGAAALAAFAGALGALGLLRAWTLLPLIFLAAAGGAWTISGRRRAGVAPWPAFPAVVIAFGAAVTLLAVATPSPFYDQIHYHLAFPERWLRDGRIDVFPRHSYSYLAANMGLLYTYALAGAGVWAAQAIHWWTGAVAAGSAFAIARKLGATPAGAAWSVAFLVATPAFLLTSTWAASDLGVAAFGSVGCLMALDAVNAEGGRKLAWYSLAGVLCGAAFGCKYTAAFSIVLPVGLFLLGSVALAPAAGRVTGVKRLLAWGAGSTAAVLPWAARNVWLTGDPLYPFLSSLLTRFAPVDAEGVARAAAGIAGAEQGGSLLASLTLRTFDPIGAAGWIGPLWLALVPLWIATLVFGRRSRAAALLAVAVLAGIAAWTRFHQLGRYLLPLLVLTAGGVGPAWERLRQALGAPLGRALTALVAALLLWGAQGGLSQEVFTRIACTFGRSDPRELLERYVTYQAALPIVNERLPADATILLVGESRAFGIERDVVVEDPFRTPYLVELAERSASAEEIAGVLRQRGISHLLYNEQEAARIARMRSRPGYFADARPEAARRLSEFLDRCVEQLGEAGAVRVYRLTEACRPRLGSFADSQ